MGWIPWRYWNSVEFAEMPGKAGRSWMTGMSGMSGTTGMSGKTGKTGMSGMSGKTGMSVNAFGRTCGWNAWNIL